MLLSKELRQVQIYFAGLENQTWYFTCGRDLQTSLFSNTVRSINLKSGGEDLWADPFLYVNCVCEALQRNADITGMSHLQFCSLVTAKSIFLALICGLFPDSHMCYKALASGHEMYFVMQNMTLDYHFVGPMISKIGHWNSAELLGRRSTCLCSAPCWNSKFRRKDMSENVSYFKNGWTKCFRVNEFMK